MADKNETGREASSQGAPEFPRPTGRLQSFRRPVTLIAGALAILTMLGIVYTLYFARPLVLPIVLAVLLNFLFSPLVRKLWRLGIPRIVSAVTLLGILLAVICLGIYRLAGPALEFAENFPEKLRQVEYKMRGIVEPVRKVTEAAKEVEEAAEKIGDGEEGADDPPGAEPDKSNEVTVRGPGLVESGLGYVQAVGVGGLITIALLLFLLASGELFLQKLIAVLPRYEDKWEAFEVMRAIERDVSRYLSTVTIINAALGTATGIALWLMGVPNPILWGAMVACFNYIPYLGAVVSVSILAIVGLVNFDQIGDALMPPVVFLGFNLIEAYGVTPYVIGRRLRMNPVMVLLSLIFWGWIWGIPGALLAVPMLVTMKLIADHIAPLKPLSEFLSGKRPESSS